MIDDRCECDDCTGRTARAENERLRHEIERLKVTLANAHNAAIAAGALLCEPVSDNDIRRAKAFLEPLYHDALHERQRRLDERQRG